jgi:enoyl-CoA hydratase/carnithine racemase
VTEQRQSSKCHFPAPSSAEPSIQDGDVKSLSDLSLTNITVNVDDEGIATVSLSRPTKHNGRYTATIEELIYTFSRLPRIGVRAAVLRAEGAACRSHRNTLGGDRYRAAKGTDVATDRIRRRFRRHRR